VANEGVTIACSVMTSETDDGMDDIYSEVRRLADEIAIWPLCARRSFGASWAGKRKCGGGCLYVDMFCRPCAAWKSNGIRPVTSHESHSQGDPQALENSNFRRLTPAGGAIPGFRSAELVTHGMCSSQTRRVLLTATPHNISQQWNSI
jgi:hypothetical protein